MKETEKTKKNRFKLDLKRPIVFFDLETTGLDVERDRIVQIAAVRCHLDGSKSVMVHLVNPFVNISKEATAVHGFTDEDVKDKPLFGDIVEDVFEFFQDADLAGYNIINFDLPMLVNEFARFKKTLDLEGVTVLDVCEIFHRKEPRDLSGAVRFYLGREFEDGHDALNDTWATIDVLDAQLNRYGLPTSPTDVVAEVRDPNAVDLAGKLLKVDGEVTVNFGKHKGRRLREVPRDYFSWMLQNNVIGSEARKIIEDAIRGKF